MITRIISVSALLLTTLLANCQDTVYYDQSRNPTDRNTAYYYEVSHYDDSIPERYVVDSFYANGSRKGISLFADKSMEEIELTKEWYMNGQLKKQRAFYGDKLNDTLLTFWENGKPKRVDIFKNGKFIKGTCYDMTGKEIPHFDYEILPHYPGGDKKLFADIFNIINIPENMKTGYLNERVITRFSVNIEGYIGEIKVIDGKYAELNKEAVRVLSSLKRWQPGLVDGEPVKIWYTVPITFTFQVR
jgi:hypothetical protein